MQNNKIVGVVLILGGMVLLGVSAGADVLKIGEGYGFGWKQITGCVIGALDVIAGVVIMNRQPPAAP